MARVYMHRVWSPHSERYGLSELYGGQEMSHHHHDVAKFYRAEPCDDCEDDHKFVRDPWHVFGPPCYTIHAEVVENPTNTFSNLSGNLGVTLNMNAGGRPSQ